MMAIRNATTSDPAASTLTASTKPSPERPSHGRRSQLLDMDAAEIEAIGSAKRDEVADAHVGPAAVKPVREGREPAPEKIAAEVEAPAPVVGIDERSLSMLFEDAAPTESAAPADAVVDTTPAGLIDPVDASADVVPPDMGLLPPVDPVEPVEADVAPVETEALEPVVVDADSPEPEVEALVSDVFEAVVEEVTAEESVIQLEPPMIKHTIMARALYSKASQIFAVHAIQVQDGWTPETYRAEAMEWANERAIEAGRLRGSDGTGAPIVFLNGEEYWLEVVE